MTRVEPLDWLRGLMAGSIMLYHLASWQLDEPGADSVLGRLGIYGVSIFFVLSGLSMATASHAQMTDLGGVGRFLLRRVFRMWPLLWLAIVALLLGNLVRGAAIPDAWVLFLNFTTLFGFIDPHAYVNTGAWSIGNEMVYYALTPLWLAAWRWRPWLGSLLSALAWVPAIVVATSILTPTETLSSQWEDYIQPWNNFGLYSSGIALFFWARHTTWPPWVSPTLILMASGLFVLTPAAGNLIVLVVGWPRLLLCLASVLVVLGFFRLQQSPPAFITRPLGALGVATYGVYLLHPFVYSVVKGVLRAVGASSPWLIVVLTVVVTCPLALVVYERFEAPLIRLGRALSSSRPHERGVA
jgi:peptidoglycan/LPS O-acetylase OafA/YrhL